jgi:hypothetical protein
MEFSLYEPLYEIRSKQVSIPRFWIYVIPEYTKGWVGLRPWNPTEDVKRMEMDL